jgi:hypothetical protein
MKKNVLLLTAILLFTVSSFSQKKDEVNFSDPFQIDSSEHFIIPRMIDSENNQLYGKGKGYLSWGSYNDIIFYNAKTNTAKPLFGKTLAIISTFRERTNYYYEKPKETPANFLDKHIIYLARTENFNNDGALDSEDPLYIFISSKTGEGLRQITPNGLNVISWTISQDKKFILVKMQNDKNGNKKFGQGDDQLYYRIDLHDDIKQIKTYQILL